MFLLNILGAPTKKGGEMQLLDVDYKITSFLNRKLDEFPELNDSVEKIIREMR